MTLLELLHLLRQHIKLVIILPVLCALVAAVYCWGFMQNQYTASTSLIVYSELDSKVELTEDTYTLLGGSQLPVIDLAALVEDEQLQKRVATQLGMEDLEDYEVVVERPSRVITISVTGAGASTVANIADEMGEVVIEVAKGVKEIREVNVITEAQVPEEPTGPSRLLYTAMALLAGLFIAIAIIVLMDMVNTRIRNEREAVELLGVPVIGRFPEAKGGSR